MSTVNWSYPLSTKLFKESLENSFLCDTIVSLRLVTIIRLNHLPHEHHCGMKCTAALLAALEMFRMTF